MTGEVISRADFLAEALSLSQQLPAQSYAINVCQDRYLFMVAYMAALFAQQVTLLPSNHAPNTLDYLLSTYQDSYCLTDNALKQGKPSFLIRTELLTRSVESLPLIDVNRVVSISFTSGSTGKPKAVAKTWAEFATAATLALQAVDLQHKSFMLVSTVPAQHMYGLETSLFWVLFSQLTIYNARPFYPEDIRLTLQSLTDTVLISTPLHLKSCVQNNTDWGKLRLILSSTAPLATELAFQLEQQFHAPLLELYGSTETLSFASRRLTQQADWQLYQGMRLTEQNGQFWVSNGHLPAPVALDDSFEIKALGLFKSLGRGGDVIKIAGKRASLSELNHLLTQLPNIEDGVFFKTKHERLAAFVVGSASKSDIISALKLAVDAVFLPKKIYRLQKLPRNSMGKLLKADLEQLISEVTGAEY